MALFEKFEEERPKQNVFHHPFSCEGTLEEEYTRAREIWKVFETKRHKRI